jgi:hypothetical protein
LAEKYPTNTTVVSASSSTTAEDRYAHIVEVLTRNQGVTFGSMGKRGFGSSALKVNDKIFAMLDSRGKFVVKLSRQRVDTLVSAGDGERFDPGHGRLMKEWLAVAPTSKAEWLDLAKEAMAFVASQH